MGNRANVVFVSGERISPAVYLHWNGGPESVYRFLEELNRRGVRSDAEYEAARFVQLVGEFFDSRTKFTTLSLGVVNGPTEITTEAISKVFTDPGDNGFYIVNRAEDPMTVRRFRQELVESPDGEYEFPMTEISPERVAAEFAEAMSDEHYADISEKFHDMTEGYTDDMGNPLPTSQPFVLGLELSS